MSERGECSTSPDEAFVSLATNDSYSRGALALGKSIQDTGSNKRLALMVSSGVSKEMRERLSQVWDELVDIEELDSGDAEHLALLSRPELGVTFSKINAWRLVHYTKCVFLDADTLILQNVDDLFEREELSAAPDVGWPDCFNSGVFVFEPSYRTFCDLLELSRQTGSFDGGDQGLLNLYWSDWSTKDIRHHLPFTYNVTPNVTYGYAPAFHRFGQNVRIIHFIGSVKPWQHRYLREVDAVILYPGTYASQNTAQDYIKRWWQVYTSLEERGRFAPQSQATGATTELQLDRRRAFEVGAIDVNGEDSFSSIQAHIDSILNQGTQQQQQPITDAATTAATATATDADTEATVADTAAVEDDSNTV